jgi:hypothetical protein
MLSSTVTIATYLRNNPVFCEDPDTNIPAAFHNHTIVKGVMQAVFVNRKLGRHTLVFTGVKLGRDLTNTLVRSIGISMLRLDEQYP